ncbi:MAG: hypothetical protein MUD16_14320 [Desulfobacterales bacterium]|jgi:hypothetical protein|nr:hypothetical protein [Desulfobacterales bacterium]
MFGFGKLTTIMVLTAVLVMGPLAAAAPAAEQMEKEKPTGGMMMWDTFALRPIGICATAIGSVVWLVSYPFALLGGNTEEATDALVRAPYEWTFERPLGEF